MNLSYGLYCLADPDFYDSLARSPGDAGFTIARRHLPDGWMRAEKDDWLMCSPEDAVLPTQGWKIHVSACLDNADEILDAVWAYSIRGRIPFKFVRSEELLFARNAKYADRTASGKLATIYPADDAQLELILTELGTRLKGQPGPYILSDLRWGSGPLYVRYGGFAERYCLAENGKLTPAIEDGEGMLVPDSREATFEVPSWVTLPGFLEPPLAARRGDTVELPYRIEAALHFSNGGGVYLGVEPSSGEEVVLKEARPHAGLSFDREDAVARLRRERDALKHLAGLDVVPSYRDYFELGDHHFLVQDFVDGDALHTLFVDRYPLIASDSGEAVGSEYTSWAVDICEQIERAVSAIHRRGLVIGDLHPLNVLVRPNGRVVLIDLEAASLASEERRSPMAAPGFLAPSHLRGFDIDRYALACLRLHMFLPLTALFELAPGKAEHLVGEIAELVPVPREFLSQAVGVISGAAAKPAGESIGRAGRPTIGLDPAGWRSAGDSMVRAILASATPDRDDRLFPGDVEQFSTGGGLGFAYGAAGVLYALDSVGAARQGQHEQWLVERAMEAHPETSLGFYDGLHGIAYVLDRLELRSEALAVLDTCMGRLEGSRGRLGLDLLGGLAGIGLNLAHFAEVTGDTSLADATWQLAGVVADRLGAEDSVPELSGGDHPHAGLLRGSSGPALLFLRLYERTGDGGLLDLAATALRQDLRRCVPTEDGSLGVNEGWRTMPYIADGSVGIGMVLDDYLLHRQDERFSQAAAAIRTAARARFYVQSGLFYGRAGMILYLSRQHPPGLAGRNPDAAAQVRRLAWHALTYRGQLAFPGDQLRRLSMDLATGTAGVLLALGAALNDPRAHLPFLGPLDSDRLAIAGGVATSAAGR